MWIDIGYGKGVGWPPGGDCALNCLTASRVQMKGPIRFTFKTFWKDSKESSSIGTWADEIPAFWRWWILDKDKGLQKGKKKVRWTKDPSDLISVQLGKDQRPNGSWVRTKLVNGLTEEALYKTFIGDLSSNAKTVSWIRGHVSGFLKGIQSSSSYYDIPTFIQEGDGSMPTNS